MMRWPLLAGGPLLPLTGIVWILQGTGRLGGSPMTDQLFWAWAGLVALIVGLGILYIGIRRKRRPPG